MTRAVLVVVVLGGCQQLFGLDAPSRRADAPIEDDAAVDAVIDSSTSDASPDARMCPPAPTGCAQVSCAATTSCYYICGTQTGESWASARDACVAKQLGCLVTLNSQAELACLAPLNATFFDQIYIGYRQTSTTDEPDGNWAWQCGASTFEAWSGGEPNNFSGAEDCGALVDDKMVDSQCTGEWRYVCELP